jgi:hypothetical protein
MRRWSEAVLGVALLLCAIMVAAGFAFGGRPAGMIAAGMIWAGLLLPSALVGIWSYRQPALQKWPIAKVLLLWAAGLGLYWLARQVDERDVEIAVAIAVALPLFIVTWAWLSSGRTRQPPRTAL